MDSKSSTATHILVFFFIKPLLTLQNIFTASKPLFWSKVGRGSLLQNPRSFMHRDVVHLAVCSYATGFLVTGSEDGHVRGTQIW